MGTYNKIFLEVIQRDCELSFAQALCERVLEKYQLDLNPNEVDIFTSELLSALKDEDNDFKSSIVSDDTEILLTEDDLAFAWKTFEEDCSDVSSQLTTAALDDIPERIFASMQDGSSGEALAQHRILTEKFCRQIQDNWKPGLDWLEILISVARETASSHYEELKESATDKELINVLVALHGKALRTSEEILCLLKSGFADGANARWRALHEIAVVSLFIAQGGGDLHTRYLRHSDVERWKAARQYQEHCDVLGYEPFSDEEMNSMRDAYQKRLSEYGRDFRGTYAWASDVLGNRNPNFTDIEKAIDMSHWRPYFKMACHSIHTGATGLFWSLGIPTGSSIDVLAGASGAGFCDPGQSTAISLTQASCAFLTTDSHFDSLIYCRVLQLLRDDVVSKFITTHEHLEERHLQLLEKDE